MIRGVWMDGAGYHVSMAMNLRLSPEETRALRRAAVEDGISMQEAALRAIDVYT